MRASKFVELSTVRQQLCKFWLVLLSITVIAVASSLFHFLPNDMELQNRETARFSYLPSLPRSSRIGYHGGVVGAGKRVILPSLFAREWGPPSCYVGRAFRVLGCQSRCEVGDGVIPSTWTASTTP